MEWKTSVLVEFCVRDRGDILEVQRRDKAESPTRSFYEGLRQERGKRKGFRLKNKTPETRELSSNRPRVFLIKNKTPVISRSFNHQSKNEQLIRPSLLISRKPKVKNHNAARLYDF